jgi:tetratricopeptide (TPR) repeat protein
MTPAAAKASPSRPIDIAQALKLHGEGRLDDAERIYSAILAAAPEHHDAQHLLGVIRHQQGRNVEALRLIGAALKAVPDCADILNNHGRVLAALSRHEEALARFAEALAIDADHLHALSNRADTLVRLNRDEEALAVYQAVLTLKPAHIGTLNKCGGLNVRLGRIAAALACYDEALAAEPACAELHINKGKAFRAVNRFAEALACFAAAAAVEPGSVEAHWNAGLVRLRLGEFEDGWRDYEWRWRKADWAGLKRDFSAPLWLGGEQIEGKTILLHAEQGLGDTIQFVRYAPLLARRGAVVILECQPDLTGLLRHVEGVAHIVARGEALPAFDLHCPLLSLPLAFGTRLETVPDAVPYIAAPNASMHKWTDRLAAMSRPRVGIAWAGNPAHRNDHNRSIALRSFAPILACDGVQFVSLQKAPSVAERAELEQFAKVASLAGEIGDFADTAGIVAQLDLVIAVDTSVAHLAGAMAKAVDLLVPFSSDWRWLIGRDDSPWYPTMRLHRQTTIGDWRSPIERVRERLSALVQTPIARERVTTCG